MIVMTSKELCTKLLELAKNSPTCKYKSVYVPGGWQYLEATPLSSNKSYAYIAPAKVDALVSPLDVNDALPIAFKTAMANKQGISSLYERTTALEAATEKTLERLFYRFGNIVLVYWTRDPEARINGNAAFNSFDDTRKAFYYQTNLRAYFLPRPDAAMGKTGTYTYGGYGTSGTTTQEAILLEVPAVYNGMTTVARFYFGSTTCLFELDYPDGVSSASSSDTWSVNLAYLAAE